MLWFKYLLSQIEVEPRDRIDYQSDFCNDIKAMMYNKCRAHNLIECFQNSQLDII